MERQNPLECQGYVRVPSGWTIAPDTPETLTGIFAFFSNSQTRKRERDQYLEYE
jgi:hypothetical protein